MKVKEILWGDPQEPNDECRYNHVKGITPLGTIVITWKQWKESPSYCVEHLETGEYLFSESSLDAAKQEAQKRHNIMINSCIEF